jgi:hypothetical protein
MTGDTGTQGLGGRDLSAERERVRAAVEEARRQFAADPNVQGIGYGTRQRRGKDTDEVVVVFHVRRKVRSEDSMRALGSRPIPRDILGVPTDVVGGEIRRASDATGERDETRSNPLVGGVASSNAAENILWFNGYGTLGTLCMKNGQAMALSNWHVWADGGDKGDDIIQPGHPRVGEHFEGLGKVAFCGPLLSSLFEWEVPSPLTWGLYGGAAALAVAAALSDIVDPIRRGQQATPTDRGERTLAEEVDVRLEYAEQPIPGTPYTVKVAWDYRRRTDRTLRTYSIEETQHNPHVLTFKQLWSDDPKYPPGSRVRLFARIGSTHPRSCGSYFVVAHYIPDKQPKRMVSTVLQPISCDQVKPPPDPGSITCVEFTADRPGAQMPPEIMRDDVRFIVPMNDPNRIVDFDHDGRGELFLHNELIAFIPPSSRVEATVISGVSGCFMEAYHGGTRLGSASLPNQPGQAVTVTVDFQGIDRIVFRRAEWECSLIRLCYVPEEIIEELPGHERPEEASSTEPQARGIAARRICCYTGEMLIPADEQVDTWRGYLVVQNINDVPAGMPPEQAAQIIGGMIVSQSLVAIVAACGALMAADHLFDII